MNAILVDAIVARAAAILVAVLVSTAAATSASAQDRYPYGAEFYRYGPGSYDYGPQVRYGNDFYGYNPSYYGYGPGYIGYGFQDIDSVGRSLGTDPNRLPVGSEAWWAAMDRTGRGGSN